MVSIQIARLGLQLSLVHGMMSGGRSWSLQLTLATTACLPPFPECETNQRETLAPRTELIITVLFGQMVLLGLFNDHSLEIPQKVING